MREDREQRRALAVDFQAGSGELGGNPALCYTPFTRSSHSPNMKGSFFDRNRGADGSERFSLNPFMVYDGCMSRTNVDIDDEACAEVMRRYRLATKREAVNFALHTLAAEPLSVEEARQLRGSGWEGDLDELRSGRST